MRVLILAAGNTHPWPGDTPRHLAPIHGEPLLHRTIRQLGERGHRPVLVTDRPHYAHPGADLAAPQPPRSGWVQEMEPSRHLWAPDGPTVILYGDTVYSEAILDALVNDWGDPWHVYARMTPSAITGKADGEMFGWAIAPRHHHTLDEARDRVVHAYLRGIVDRALSWEVYRDAVGIPMRLHAAELVHMVQWDDETDDLDEPADLEQRIARGLA